MDWRNLSDPFRNKQPSDYRNDRSQRRLVVCPCGDPLCSFGPQETQEAARRGEINPEDLRRATAEARNEPVRPNDYRGGTFMIDYAREEPRQNKLAELREKVKDWIVPAPTQSFDDIIGNEAALEQLRDAIRAPVEEKDLYEAYGMSMPKGALLSGPPGCGKTMFAKAAACEMKKLYKKDVEMISVSGPELQSPFVGVTEGRIKDIFTFAREYNKVNKHPLLVFIDEAETLFPDRTGRVRRVAPWEESQVAAFLAEMDGMQESGAFVLLASNRPEVIDSAILRDGRCDFKITIARPTAAALEGILVKNFTGIFTNEPEADLVFAAIESLLDPHKVLFDLRQLMTQAEDWFAERGFTLKDETSIKKMHTMKSRNFMFEHILSGAMAASIPGRAKRYAFSRDRKAQTRTGVTTADVVAAVTDLFEENKKLEHAFAMQEFLSELEQELENIK